MTIDYPMVGILILSIFALVGLCGPLIRKPRDKPAPRPVDDPRIMPTPAEFAFFARTYRLDTAGIHQAVVLGWITEDEAAEIAGELDAVPGSAETEDAQRYRVFKIALESALHTWDTAGGARGWLTETAVALGHVQVWNAIERGSGEGETSPELKVKIQEWLAPAGTP